MERRTKAKKQDRCFLTAPSSMNLDSIRAALTRRGIRPIERSELIQPGVTLAEQLKDAISKSDLVVAVLNSDQANANVCIELGVAIGLGKRIFLVAPHDAKLPSDTSGFLRIMASADNIQAINFALDQAKLGHVRKPSKFVGIEKTKPIGRNSVQLVHMLDSRPQPLLEIELVEIIAAALRTSGARVTVSERIEGSLRPDIAVWADELSPWVGNPFIIEVKRVLPDRIDLGGVTEQVSQYMATTNSQWALVLYGGPVHSHLSWRVGVSGIVLFMNVRVFLDALRTRSFAEIILDLRNQAAHGR